MRNATTNSNVREKIIAIMAEVTGCSTKKIWGGTKIEKVFESLGDDDVWKYLDFCEMLEETFSIKLSTDECIDILGHTLLALEIRISKKMKQ